VNAIPKSWRGFQDPGAHEDPPVRRGFVGCFTDQHRFLLSKMLARVDALDTDIDDTFLGERYRRISHRRGKRRPSSPSGVLS
jgi:hypothetical protein